MRAFTFNTFEAIHNLQQAGLSERAAKAVVDTVKQSFDDNVATKADIAKLRGELRGEMKSIQTQLMIWMVAVVGIGLTLQAWIQQ